MENNEMNTLPIFDTVLPELYDGKLQSDDGFTFDIHRVILARNNEYFRSMFCGIGKDRREFRIPGINGGCLSEILHFIYTGEIYVTEENITDLMVAADYLLIEDLYKQIKESFKDKLAFGNCIRFYHAAYQINDEDIIRESFRFIETNFEEVKRTQKNGLLELPLGILKYILSSRRLCVYGENTVWQTVVEWVQKDISMRLCCVPQLLMTLAGKDLYESLETEILHHKIVSKNPFMQDLKEINDSTNSTNNFDTVLQFLGNRSGYFQNSSCYRIPTHLHAISSYTKEGEDWKYNLHMTYDDKLDLWRKIGKTDIFDPEISIVIGHIIYIFDIIFNACMKFDLIAQQWIPMESIPYDYSDVSIVQTGGFIYALGEFPENGTTTFGVHVYDTANNRWFEGISLGNICQGVSVTDNKNIYVVGTTRDYDGMMTEMFDPVTQRWTLLSPPIVNRRANFVLAANLDKIYLIGGQDVDEDQDEDDYEWIANVEVFDPESNSWEELPNLPHTYSWIKAIVLNDQIIVHGHLGEDYDPNSARWNAAEKRWEELEETNPFGDLYRYSITRVDDVDTVRTITKENRDPETHFDKSPFS